MVLHILHSKIFFYEYDHFKSVKQIFSFIISFLFVLFIKEHNSINFISLKRKVYKYYVPKLLLLLLFIKGFVIF